MKEKQLVRRGHVPILFILSLSHESTRRRFIREEHNARFIRSSSFFFFTSASTKKQNKNKKMIHRGSIVFLLFLFRFWNGDNRCRLVVDAFQSVRVTRTKLRRFLYFELHSIIGLDAKRTNEGQRDKKKDDGTHRFRR